MRFVLVVLMGLLSTPAWAETPADAATIQSVITQQLDAFQKDDADGAFALASPMIQQMFGTAGNFLSMVQRGYPPVHRGKRASFGALVEQDGQLVQKVDLIGPDGLHYLALYAMEREPDGTWKINGCSLTASESVGA